MNFHWGIVLLMPDGFFNFLDIVLLKLSFLIFIWKLFAFFRRIAFNKVGRVQQDLNLAWLSYKVKYFFEFIEIFKSFNFISYCHRPMSFILFELRDINTLDACDIRTRNWITKFKFSIRRLLFHFKNQIFLPSHTKELVNFSFATFSIIGGYKLWKWNSLHFFEIVSLNFFGYVIHSHKLDGDSWHKVKQVLLI